MQELIPVLDQWLADGERIAIATVIYTWGSSPRPVGSRMILTASGRFEGSVSMGCVEGQVIEESKIVLKTGQPVLLEFGVSNDEAWNVGLTCGGRIEILLEPFTRWQALYPAIRDHLANRRRVALLTLVGGPDGIGDSALIVEEDEEAIMAGLAADFAADMPGFIGGGSRLVERGDRRLFIGVMGPKERLCIIGGSHVAVSLAPLAALAGFEVIVIDPRRAFLTDERFPGITMNTAWPDKAFADLGLTSSDYVVAVTHDPKIDDPGLVAALNSPARYIGALGSKPTNQKRVERLGEMGFSDEAIARIHAPIGLPIGSSSTEDIAVSILAEMIAVKNGMKA